MGRSSRGERPEVTPRMMPDPGPAGLSYPEPVDRGRCGGDDRKRRRRIVVRVAISTVAIAGAVRDAGHVAAVLLPVLSVVLAGALAAAAVFRHPHVLVTWVAGIQRHVGRHLGRAIAATAERVRDLSRELREFHPSTTTWAAAFGLSAAN